ncbi:MAG: TonB family protein [Fibrobacteres bacterium]|nr:TonB family protein [Fibrobacterota bacterium]
MSYKTKSGFSAIIIPLLILTGIVVFTVLFNLSVIDIRYQELDSSLYKVAYQQDLNKSLSMLSKVSILKRRLETGSESAEEYALESKIMAVIGSDLLKESADKPSKWSYMRPVARVGMNGIRLLMGKGISSDDEKSKQDNKELEVAYFYERNRRYDKSLEMYKAILKAKKHSADMVAVIELHKGFCEAMSGDFTTARKTFEDVIAQNPDSETATVAWRLLDFMNTMDDERAAMSETGETSLEYGKKLYLLMEYRKAISVLADFATKSKNVTELAEAVFLKGRSHEELGDPAMAIDAYREVISKYGNSTFAQEANRRIYILGEFYERDKDITNIALQRLKEYKDESFFDELNTYSEIVEESKVTDEARLKQREEVRKAISGNGDVLDVIDRLDLSGEKAVAESVKAEESRMAKAEDIRKTEDAKAKIIEADKLDVNEHPMRKPSYLGREIKRRAVVLQNIYNGMLKRGEDFGGTIKLQFYIERDGTVTRTQIDPTSSLTNQQFKDKVTEQVQNWQFPAIEDGYGAQKVTYPITFQKTE